MPPINKIALTREAIENGKIHQLIKNGDYGVTFISDEERQNSLKEMFNYQNITYKLMIFFLLLNFQKQKFQIQEGNHHQE